MDSFFDVLFRSAISIIVLFFITELMGKKQISQLNMFDYIIGISIGSIAASLSVDDSIHYFDGILSIIIYGVIATSISFLTTKSIVMRRFFLMCLLPIFLATGVFAQPQADEYPYDLTYFLPEGSQVYDPQVPTPEKILGFQLGEQHAGWDQVVE